MYEVEGNLVAEALNTFVAASFLRIFARSTALVLYFKPV